MGLGRVRWESAARPLALLGGAIVAIALLPSLLASEPPPPPPADVGFEALAPVEPVTQPEPAPTVAPAAVKELPVRARKGRRSGRPAAARGREQGPARADRERRKEGRRSDPAPAPPAPAPAPAPTYPSYGGSAPASAGEFRFER